MIPEKEFKKDLLNKLNSIHLGWRDEDIAEQAQELIDEGLDDDDAVEIAEEL